MIPPEEDKPNGLHRRYDISKADGSAVDPSAAYFVLRLDSGGSDKVHTAACREAAKAYAAAILLDGEAVHLHETASDLMGLVDNIEREIEGGSDGGIQ